MTKEQAVAKTEGKLWVAVEVYQLIVTDVHVFSDFDKAKAWFKGYTGIEYSVDERGELPDNFYERIPKDFDQTKVFEVEAPESEGGK